MSLYDYYREALSWHYLVKSGEGLWRAISDAQDELVGALRQAAKVGFARLAPADALPEIGRTFNLDFPARIATDLVRDYLADPWEHWRNAGSKGRMVAELNFLGYANVEVVSYRDLVDTYGKPDTVFGGFSSFWYLIIKKPNPWQRSGPWNQGNNTRWNQVAAYTWNSTATASEIREIKQTIAKWKPAASSCRFIEVWLEVNLFGAPVKIVRWPIWEPWEIDSNGGAANFYNFGY